MYLKANQGFFPSKGEEVNVHVVEFDPVVDLVTLDELANELLAMTSVVTEVDAWVVEFRAYLQDNHLVDEEGEEATRKASKGTIFPERFSCRGCPDVPARQLDGLSMATDAVFVQP